MKTYYYTYRVETNDNKIYKKVKVYHILKNKPNLIQEFKLDVTTDNVRDKVIEELGDLDNGYYLLNEL